MNVTHEFAMGGDPQDLKIWAAWNLTTYGVQFATMARVIGAEPMVIW